MAWFGCRRHTVAADWQYCVIPDGARPPADGFAIDKHREASGKCFLWNAVPGCGVLELGS